MSQNTLSSRPPERIDLTSNTALRRAHSSDAEPLAAGVAASIRELRPWLAWASDEAMNPDAQRERLRQKDSCWENGTEFVYSITLDNQLIGSMGLDTRCGPRVLEIGYWLRTDRTGRGVVTAASRALTTAALALDGIERVEIHCDEANSRSAAVPSRLGYRLDRIDIVEPIARAETGRRMVWVWPPGAD